MSTSNITNYKPKEFAELLNVTVKKLQRWDREKILVAGFDWFEKFCNKFNVEIVVVKNEKLSPHEELVHDIANILDEFSCRLCGLSKYRKQIERDEAIAKGVQNGACSD